MNVYEKLQDARVQLQKKSLKKSGKNKFSGFDYFELADFLPAVNAIFADLKLASVFKLTEQEAFLNIINAEKPDEVIEFSMPSAQLELKGCNALQALGGVNTYCRRYLYFNALEIVENDFFDAETGKDKVINKQKKPVKKEEIKPEAQPVIVLDNADIDLFEGAKACASYEELGRYYKTNFQTVKDKTAFNQLVNELKGAFAYKEAEKIY